MRRGIAGVLLAATLATAAQAAILAMPAQAAAREPVEVTTGPDGTQVTIHLDLPLRYVSHFPRRESDVLQIELEPVVPGGPLGEAQIQGKLQMWIPDANSALADLFYEAGAGDAASLTLFFRRPVLYQVTEDRNRQRLIVLLPNEVAAAEPSSSASSVSVPLGGWEFALPPEPKLAEAKLAESQLASAAPPARSASDRPLLDITWPESSEDTEIPAPDESGVPVGSGGAVASAGPVSAEPDLGASGYAEIPAGNEGEVLVGSGNADVSAALDSGAADIGAGGIEEIAEDARDPEEEESETAVTLALLPDVQPPEDEETPPEPEPGRRVILSGNFSQNFSRTANLIDEQNISQNINDATTEADTKVTIQDESYEASLRLTNNQIVNLGKNGGLDAPEVTNAYGEMIDFETQVSARVGRQSRNGDGVRAAFDGAAASYQVTEDLAVTGLAGLGELNQGDFGLAIDGNSTLAGLSLELANAWENVDLNLYFINQFNDDFSNRNAIGGSAFFEEADRSTFLLADFDVFSSGINAALFNGTRQIGEASGIEVSVDYRRNPFINTRNPAQGENTVALAQLEGLLDEDQLEDLADDRTAVFKALRFGAFTPVSQKFQLSGDFTLANFFSTDDLAGIELAFGDAPLYFVNLRLQGNSVLRQEDTLTFGLSHIGTGENDEYTFNFDTGIPLGPALRLTPALQLTYRANDGELDDEFITRPSARLTYLVTPGTELEFEIGAEWLRAFIEDDPEDNLDYFFSFAYRINY